LVEDALSKLRRDCPTAKYILALSARVQTSIANDESHNDHRKGKEYAQKIATDKWDRGSLKSIKEMAEDVHEIFLLEGKEYVPSTIRFWISKVAPLQARKPGRPAKK